MATMEMSDTAVIRAALATSVLSLVLSGWAFLGSVADDAADRRSEQRLVCLELPGPNDCGADGR